MYVTTHDTAKFSSLTFIVYLTANNIVSSTSEKCGLIESVLRCLAIGDLPLEALEEWSPTSWVTSCFLRSNLGL